MRVNAMNSPRSCKNRRTNPVGFTLIELLVVISIIALLVSLLLPSLSGARRTGQRVACMAKLRDIAKGMQEYAMDNEEWIIGSPWGSGTYLQGVTTAFGPSVQDWDFMGPMARMWNMGLMMGSGQEKDVVKRFNQLRGHGAFLCPANKFLSFKYSASSGPDAGAGWMVSYNTARLHLWPGDEWPSFFGEKPPPHWRPAVNRMGNPSNKVFCADGGRYSRTDQVPDYDLEVQGDFGGAFADAGVYKGGAAGEKSKSWDRSRAPGNASSGRGDVDARMYAFRHSTSVPPDGAQGNAYKLNLAYYDGHVETMGDLEASNPHLWLPKGSRIEQPGTCLWQDTVDFFGITGEDLLIGS